MTRRPKETVNVSDAKRHFSDLLGRVAYGGETILITRRGRPMAKLVPPSTPDTPRLRDLQGWLDDDDPFLETIERTVERRREHRPRVLEDEPVAGE